MEEGIKMSKAKACKEVISLEILWRKGLNTAMARCDKIGKSAKGGEIKHLTSLKPTAM
jgi:hypothetical protein